MAFLLKNTASYLTKNISNSPSPENHQSENHGINNNTNTSQSSAHSVNVNSLESVYHYNHPENKFINKIDAFITDPRLSKVESIAQNTLDAIDDKIIAEITNDGPGQHRSLLCIHKIVVGLKITLSCLLLIFTIAMFRQMFIPSKNGITFTESALYKLIKNSLAFDEGKLYSFLDFLNKSMVNGSSEMLPYGSDRPTNQSVNVTV